MPIYQLNEGTLELPDNYTDQTMNVFPNSPSSGSDFSVVITRDVPLANEDLKSYFDKQLKQLPGALPGIKILRRGELTVGGLPALEVEYDWISKGRKMHHRQVSMMPEKLVLNITASAAANNFQKYAAEFDQILNSFKF